MLYYDREGYYTYKQVAEAFEYVKMEDPTDDKYHQNFFYDHLKSILEQMKQYKMEIVFAREVLKYDEFTRAMVDTYRIVPTPFKSKTHDYSELQISAPNYREAEFCGNCVHFNDQTDYDDLLNGVCDIHTEINVNYNPPLKSPLSLGCHGVCDNFEFAGCHSIVTGHTIYEYEIKSVMDAANQLFSPQEGGGDDRTAFQTIHHIMDGVKGRSW